MTTIKVGEYEVWPCVKHHGWQVRTVHDVIVDCRNTLPMALRVAAEAAGIERQRVVVFAPYWLTTNTAPADGDYPDLFPTQDFWADQWTQEAVGDLAHEYARERYAALGGAA